MNKRRRYYVVGIDIPKGMSEKDIADYIREAVKSQAGASLPPDPICELDRSSITVVLEK